MWTGSLGLSRAEDVEEGRAAMQMNEKICTKVLTNIGGWTGLDSDMVKFTLTPRLYSVAPSRCSNRFRQETRERSPPHADMQEGSEPQDLLEQFSHPEQKP